MRFLLLALVVLLATAPVYSPAGAADFDTTLAPLDVPAKSVMTKGVQAAMVDESEIYSRTGVGEAVEVAPLNDATYSSAPQFEEPVYQQPVAYAPTFSSTDPERNGTGEYVPSSFSSANLATPSYEHIATPIQSYNAPIPLVPGSQPLGVPQDESAFKFVRNPTAYEAGAFSVMAPPQYPTGMQPVTAGGFTFVPRANIGVPPDAAIANNYPRNVYDGPVHSGMNPQMYWFNDAARREAQRRQSGWVHR